MGRICSGVYQPYSVVSLLNSGVPPICSQTKHIATSWCRLPSLYCTTQSAEVYTPTSFVTFTVSPVSSITSRSHASAALSPGSMRPPGRHHLPLSARRVRRIFSRAGESKITAAHPTINVVPRPMRGPLRICIADVVVGREVNVKRQRQMLNVEWIGL